ncbi:MAG TPA: porin [Bryobacteraceae bacterium]|nr:porin [Bryobacteraceae bacterium]
MTFHISKVLSVSALSLALISGIAAQTPAPAGQTPAPAASPAPTPAPAPAASPAPEWSVGPIDFSGLIDGYYDVNFNHPASGVNGYRNFDVKADQFQLNMAKVTLNHDPDPVGFRMDLGFGRAFDMVHSSEQAPDIFRYLEQAYIEYKPAKAKGLQLDFGEFVTSAGAEVIETYSNWNYSRSLLFAWALPYYHFGLRATIPVGSHFTGGVQLVNGWNNVDDNNSGKTVGLVGAFNTKKFTWSNNYYVGPENSGTNTGLRQLYDTTLLLTPTDKASFYINYDYGADNRPVVGKGHWDGIAGAARFQLNKTWAIAQRLEWFNDATGFSTGTVQKLKEFTFTTEYKAAEGLLVRGEYRHDWSNVDAFDRGNQLANWKNQDTLLVGFVAYFGPKR